MPRKRPAVLHTGIDVDLRRGWAYMVARRAKLIPYALAVVGFGISNGYLHGDALHWAEVGIGLAGALGVHQIPVPKTRKARR